MNIRFRAKPFWLIAVLLLALVLVSGCARNPSTAFNEGIEFFSQGEYAEAADVFERLGDYRQAPTYAAYSRGLVYFEQGDYLAAEPCFEKTQDFMYGKSRYAFCRAYRLESEGDYAQAAELYAALGEFENSVQTGRYCEGRIAEEQQEYEAALYAYAQAGQHSDAAIRLEELQYGIYTQAMGLKVEGITLLKETIEKNDTTNRVEAMEKLSQAFFYFTVLGDYYISAEQAVEVKSYIRDEEYVEAEALLAEGKTQEAYEAFLALSGYSDAETRAEELAAQLGIGGE